MKQKKILNFLSSGFLLYVMINFYSKIISFNKSAELVCEIRGYEQLLNCWFQITTFICLLVFFIFFVVSLPLFLIIISNLRKVYQKSNIFFYINFFAISIIVFSSSIDKSNRDFINLLIIITHSSSNIL